MVLKSLDRLWFSYPVRAARGAAAGAADLIAPTWCVGCRAEATDLCLRCSADLHMLTRRPYRAEEPAEALPILPDLNVLPVYSAAEYTTLMADTVLAFKDHERVQLARLLAPALGRAVEAAAELCRGPDFLVIWPPPTLRSQLRRGRHPLGELIDRLILPHGVWPAGHLVRHRVRPKELHVRSAQKSRSKRARRRTDSSLSLQPGAAAQLNGTEVLLIDDVLTTGTTLGHLFAVLTGAGAQVRGAAVLAATPR